jgi:hypothetical protein
MKFNNFSQCSTLILFNIVHCTLLSFVFDDIKSLWHNLGLIWTGLNLENF